MTARPLPWYQTVSPSSTDPEYFTAAPAGFSLRIRPRHTTDAPPITGTWCPPGMQLCVLANRGGQTATFWIDASATLNGVWTDDQIRELLFLQPREMDTIKRMQLFSITRASIPCPTA